MKFIQVFVASLLLVTFAQAKKEVVNLYSHRHYDVDKEIYKSFEKKTGIKVNVVKAKASQLIKKIAQEGKNTPADILMTADVARLYKAKKDGLLQPLKSKYIEKAVPKNLRDGDMQWIALTKRARIIVYAKDRVKKSELSTYEDLASPKWKGKIVTRSSSHPYNQSLIASIIANDTLTGAKKWIKGVVANFARTPKGNDRAQVVAIANGIGDLAIVNTYYIGKMITNKKDKKQREAVKKVGVFFPNQKGRGAHINISGAGITKYAKNKKNAIKLLEFLLSKEVQETFAARNFEYPVLKGVKQSKIVASWGSFVEDSLALEKLGELNKEAVKLADEFGWK